MEGTGAVVDWPGLVFYEELMRAYPDAKVILTVREPGRWYTGWGPLGEFPGARAPVKPFPHLNERVIFLKTIRRRFAVPVGGSLVAALTLLYTLLRARSG